MYPITYEADYLRERNRLTTFFRLILAIPWYIVNYIYTLVAAVAVVIAWFAVVILGRYPQWAYDFVAGVLRFSTRYNAWFSLQVDEFPPFGIGPDPTYPVRLQIADRAEKQSRIKALFRIILAIPLVVVYYIIVLLHYAASWLAWLTIVFRGYQPAGLHNALAFTNAWIARVTGYLFLLCDQYPPVGDEPVQVGDVRRPAPPPPPAMGGSAAGS